MYGAQGWGRLPYQSSPAASRIAESSSPMSYTTNALLFDLDDTLFDRDRAFRSWAESFVRTHLEAQDEVRYREAVDCLVSLDASGYCPRETLFSKAKEIYPSLQQSVDHLVETFYQQFLLHISLEEETQWLLDALGQANIPFGIVTNGSHRQKHKIEVLGLDKLTSCIFISEKFGCKKPEAKIFLAAASCLGAAAGEVLFVGDNPYADIWGAQRVGMKTAWLHRGRAWPSDLSSTPAEIIIGSLEELFTIL
jgi:putative hydrolase of the HAD superfamily